MNTRQYETRRRSPWVGFGAAAVVLMGAGLGVHAVTTSSAAAGPVLERPHWAGNSGAGGPGSADVPAGNGWSSRGAGRDSAITTATQAQQAGVVDIDVVLGRGERAAGTGMILTSNGEVLTNKHVVSGETSMTVTVTATGRTYAAHVVGVAADTDVAVVQMSGASGLDTVTRASSGVSLGDPVVGVGNAGGQGGTPSAAHGRVTGLGQTITATDETGGDPEQLTGLIETDAPIHPGDSGGPLLNASNQVVGMDTAGSARGAADAYAIPIATAVAAARQIESSPGADIGRTGSGQGDTGGTATQAGSAYLGVEVVDGQGGLQGGVPGGVRVAAVVDGSPASAAGVVAGDTITSVARRPVESVSDLASVLASLSPGQRVRLTWVDPYGGTQSSTVTLAAGPGA